MNPRRRQFALGGTLSAWTVLDEPDARQERLLRRCYRGLEPRILSKYGTAQLRAALPWRRTIVKDPFAMLSIPTIVRVTDCVPVVVFRHPGAVLVSYRRMGWSADTEEMRRLPGAVPTPRPRVTPRRCWTSGWTCIAGCCLGGTRWPRSIVSHSEVSRGGRAAVQAVATACGLGVVPASGPPNAKATSPSAPEAGALHRFDRSPQEVAEGWRTVLDPAETSLLEQGAAEVWDELQERRLDVTVGPPAQRQAQGEH